MRIVIAGAGSVGFHLAELLAKENQDIVLIDKDEEALSHASNHLDVLTIKGDAASIEILKQAKPGSSKLFIAVTTSEKTNLLLAILAKQMGVKITIARINNSEYLLPDQRKRFKSLGIDVLISPNQLAAQEVVRLVKRASFTDLFEFEDGKLSIVGITITEDSPLINRTIDEINTRTNSFVFNAIALLRNGQTIIPTKDVKLLERDHLYFSTKSSYLDSALKFIGKSKKPIKNIMILGGGALGLKTAKLLEEEYDISIVLKDKKEERRCIELLNNGMVIHAEPGNIDILKEEGLEQMDAFVALTPNSETNIITSLTAEELGVSKTIALVDNVNYTHISQNIGIDTIINKKLIAANNIFRFVRKGKVEAVASLHGVDAEVIEFIVHKKNRVLKHELKDLHFPQNSIIAGVIRGDKVFIPSEDFKFEINDKVIVLARNEAIRYLEEIFK